MLSSACQWYYGFERCNFLDHCILDKIGPGCLIARKAMADLPKRLRAVSGALHFGGVTQVENDAFCSDPLIRLSYFKVMHYVKDHNSHTCEVKETSLFQFLFGNKKSKEIQDYSDAIGGFVLFVNEKEKQEKILEALYKSKGSTNYNLFNRNCEHWLQTIFYGKKLETTQSIQIELAITSTVLLILFVGIILFLRKKNKTKKKKNKIFKKRAK